MIRVVVIDDEALVRSAFALLLGVADEAPALTGTHTNAPLRRALRRAVGPG